MQQEISSLKKVNRVQNWCRENLGPLAGFATIIIGAVTVLVFLIKKQLLRARRGLHSIRTHLKTNKSKYLLSATTGTTGKIAAETIGKSILHAGKKLISSSSTTEEDAQNDQVKPPPRQQKKITTTITKKRFPPILDTPLKHVENGLVATTNNIWISVFASIVGGYIVYTYTVKKK